MYIVNTTFVILPKAHGSWYEFFTNKVLPMVKQDYDVLAFSRILHQQKEDHYSYSLMVELDNVGDFEKYNNDIVGQYAEMAKDLYGEQALHFTSILKKIEQ